MHQQLKSLNALYKHIKHNKEAYIQDLSVLRPVDNRWEVALSLSTDSKKPEVFTIATDRKNAELAHKQLLSMQLQGINIAKLYRTT